MQLNKDLLKTQNVTKEQEENLHQLYKDLYKLLEDSKNDKTQEEYDKTNKKLTELEFNLQRNWNFELDENFHTYWLSLPQCNCPKLDNKENFGTKYRIISSKCKCHWID